MRASNERSIRGAFSSGARRTLNLVAALFMVIAFQPAATNAQTDKGPPRLRHVYIPHDELEAIFGEGKQGALLTRTQFMELWQKARGELAPPPPVDAVMTRARYEAELAEHELKITTHVQLVKLQEGWQTLEMQFGGVAIGSAKVNGQLAQLGRNSDGCLFWVIRDKGRFDLTLELSAPVVRTGGDLTASIHLPPLPSSEFLLRLPQGKQVRAGGVEVKPDSLDGPQQTVRIPVNQSGHLVLGILDLTGGSKRVPLVFVSTVMAGTVEPSGVRWQADVTLDVAAQPTDKFRLRLPADVDVASVESPDLRGWNQADHDGDRSELAIEFRQPFQGQRRVRVTGLAPIKLGEPWSMPAVEVVDAVSNVGEIMLQPATTLRLETVEMSDIRRLGFTEKLNPGSGRLRFAFWNEQFRLQLKATPRERELSVGVASLVDVARTGLTLRANLTVEPRYAPLFDLTLQLPRDWTITSLQANGVNVAWESVDSAAQTNANIADPATQFVHFDLQQPVVPGTATTIVLSAELYPANWLENEREFSSVPLPAVQLVGADEIEGTLVVESPRELETRVGDLSPDLEPVPPPPGRATADVGTALAYHHQDDAVIAGRIESRIKPAQISVETIAFASLGRESLGVHFQADLQINGGQIRTLDFTLPASVGEAIHVAVINQQVRVIGQQHTVLSEESGDGEQFLWHIVFDRPVTGLLVLTVSFEQKRSEESGTGQRSAGTGSAALPTNSPLLAQPAFRNVARQTGYIAIEAANDQEVEQQVENLREVDPADLPMPAEHQPGRIIAAYQYLRLPYRLRLSGERRDSKEVLAAACDRAVITSVLGDEGIMRHQARYDFRSLGVQHLAVKLPGEASLWSVTLDGTPIEVRRTSNEHIVPLPAGGANRAAGQHTVELVYETRTSAVFGPAAVTSNATARQESAGRRAATTTTGLVPETIRQAAPMINLTVLALTWNVHLPDGSVLVASEGEFKPVVEPTRPGILTRIGQVIAANSTRDIGVKLIYLGCAAAAGCAIWLLLQSRSLVIGLVVVASIGVVIALLLPAAQMSRESSRRAECRNNMKQIAVALQNYHDVYGQFPPATIGPHNVPADRQLSWIVALLPFLEHRQLYNQFRLDLPWDHPLNMAAARTSVELLTCPESHTHVDNSGFPRTSYVAVLGQGPAAPNVAIAPGQRGIFGFDRSLSIREVVDGTAMTLMLVETPSGGAWAAGGHSTARALSDNPASGEFASQHGNGTNAAYADGSVRFLTPGQGRTVSYMATAAGGEVVDVATLDASASQPARFHYEAKTGAVREAELPGNRKLPVVNWEVARDSADTLATAPGAAESVPERVLATGPTTEATASGATPVTVAIPAPVPPPASIPSLYSQLARLSLSLNLEVRGSPALQFTQEGDSGELILRVQDDSLARRLGWAITAACAIVAWLMRSSSRRLRAAWALLCIIVPIGVSGLLPLAWTIMLDGLFIGGLCSIALWIIHATVQQLAIRVTQWRLAKDSAPHGSAAVITATIFSLSLAGLAWGQTGPTAPAATATVTAQEQLPRTEPMSASPAKAVSFDSKPLTIYIPYDPKNGDPRESRFVYLPYDEFQELWKLANPDKPVDVGPGVTSTIAEVGYEGRLDGDVARFDGRIVLYTFRDEWTRVALPLASVALEKVELDGQPATLEERTDEKPEVIKPASPGNPGSPANADSRAADTAGRLSIYVEKAGMHVVDIRFSVPVTRFGATGRLTIPFRSAAAGKLRFELPAPELDLHIEGATGGWRIEKQLDQVESNVGQSSSTSDADNDDDVIHQSGQHGESLTVGVDLIKSQEAKEAREWLVLPVGGAAEVVVRWQPRRGELSETRLVSADQTVLVDIQDSGVHLRSQVHYRIAQGSLRKLELRVPRGVAIRSVVGADIADWSVVRDLPAEDAESSGEGRLEIALKTDVRTGTDIEIGAYLVGQQPSGLVAVQTLEPLGMSRETGRIVIGCTAQFHVRIGETSNIVQIERDGVQLPGGSDEACGLLAAYRYTGRPWSMQIVIDRLRSRVNSTARTAVHVTRERITVHAILEAVVSDAPIASLRLQLPQGMRINRVNLPAGSDWYIDRTGQALQLLVELAQPVSGKIPVELIGTLPLDANATELQVPFVALLEASDEAGQIAVAFDQDIEAFGADFGGTRPIPPSELTGSLQQFAKASRVFAFQYDRTPEGLSLGLRSAGSQLSADVLSTVSVREGSVSYLSEINFEIRGTARSRLQFVTPPILGADIELQGNGIRQTQSESDSSGFRTWTVHFQQPIRGGYAIRLLQSLPVPADGTIRAAIIQPVEADPVRSYIILENRAATQLTEAETRGVSSLAASDVPLPLTDELRRRAISAHKVLDHQASLTWLRHEREQEKAIAAHANLADLVTVIHRDGTYRTQAAYVITNRTRQFLEIALPPNSELWAVHVAGQPVRPATVKRANRDVTLVPLQRVSAGDISIQVVLVYAGSLGGKIGRWTKITPPAPEMLGNVPVARTLWTVYTPEEFSTAIVDADSNMTPVAAGDLIVARDLAFFEELNELIKVCKFSSSENANRLACNNLKQLGAALSAFQRPAAPLSIGALDNRQGWREADSNTLSAQIENFYCPSDRADGAVRLGELKGKDTWAIVQQRARELQTEIHAIVTKDQAGTQEGQVGIQLQSQLDDYFSKSKSDGAEKATDRKPSGAELFSLQQENVNADERESRRYKMREQNWANVEKLKEQQDQTRALQTPEQAVDGLAQNARPSGARAPVGAGLGGMASGSKPSFRPAASIPQTPGGGAGGGAGTQLIGGDATTRAGIQSIGIEIPRVGKPQHFMRILGDPKLVVSARHQDLGRWSGRLVWAALCLGFAAFLLIALSQSRVWAFIYAQWPWFAAATGVAWLFLLPLGLGGLLLAVPAIAVLAWRTRARTATAN